MFFFLLCFLGAPQVLRYSVAKEVEAVSGRDVRLEMEVCSDPIPSKTTWDWGSLRVEAGQVSFCNTLEDTLNLQLALSFSPENF